MRGGAADHRARRGLHALRHRRKRLHRRRLVAVVQRPRPCASADRPRGARPARARRPHDDARPLASGRDRARAAPRGARAARPEPRLLLRQRLDRGRGRPEDGVSVLAPPRRARARRLHLPARRLSRRHDRLGVGRRDRPLPCLLRAAAVRHLAGGARRHRAHGGTAARARRDDRGGHRRAARAGRGGDDHATRRATCARCARSATSTTCC